MRLRLGPLLGLMLLLAAPQGTPAASATTPDLWAATPLAPPGVRNGQSAIADPTRNRLIVFGGNTGTAPLNDTWALDLTTHTWTPLATAGAPPSGRYKHVAVLDAPRDRMVIFGGYNGTGLFNDTWALNLQTLAWTQLPTSGAVPSKRARHCAVMNPANGTMVVFGGYNGTTIFNDLYALNLVTNAWVRITAVGTLPEARQGQSAIYDPVRGSMVVFGGNGAITPLLSDTWSLNLATNAWTLLSAGAGAPGGRFDHGVAYDATRGAMVIFGGQTSLTAFRGDTWSFNLSSNLWSQIPSAGPAARTRPAMAYDATHDAAVLFGGQAASGSLNDLWSLPLAVASWSEVPSSGTPPPPTLDYSIAWDPALQGSIIFGGWAGTFGTEHNNTYVLSVTGGANQFLSWTTMTTFNRPAPRFGHAAVYDPVTNQYLVYGGFLGAGTWTNELWSLNPSTGVWTNVSYGFPLPTPLAGVGAVFDAANRRMIVYGGTTTGGGYASDCWGYNIDANSWTQLGTSGPQPAARGGNAAISDDAHGRMVIWSGASNVGYFNDTWALDYATDTWQLLPTTNTPAGRGSIAPAYDASRNRMICWGGQSSLGGLSNQTDFLDLGTLAWTTGSFAAGTAPSARASIWASYDPARNWMVMWGGNDPGATNSGGILYNAADAAAPGRTAPPAARTARAGLPAASEGNSSAPSRTAAAHPLLDVRYTPERVHFALTLAEAAPTLVTLYDIHGRLVARDDRGTLAAGAHAWVWDAHATVRPLTPGVYVAHVRAGGVQLARKITLF